MSMKFLKDKTSIQSDISDRLIEDPTDKSTEILLFNQLVNLFG